MPPLARFIRAQNNNLDGNGTNKQLSRRFGHTESDQNFCLSSIVALAWDANVEARYNRYQNG
ncbi:hypothetical protein NON20_20755 [Synechocystis sp. B12]|nr:hypothetical protein NON20_20755 [Synechocystis sp. B12]